jgi:type VI secretion system protein ImpK
MRLTDYFMDVIAYTAYLVKTSGTRQAPYEQVNADILRLLGESEECVRKGLCTEEEYDLSRFMVCAWIDEMILGSRWEHRGHWQREQLQRRFYNTFEAGEEVFERLNAIGYQQNNVREVYYLCLSLGFKGRFINPEDDYLLDQLKMSNLKILLGSPAGLPALDRGDLFPESYPTDAHPLSQRKRGFQFTPFSIAVLAGPVVLFGLLFVIYYFSLSGIADHFLETVR